MRRLQIGIIDLVSRDSRQGLYGRVMDANLAAIMPQIIGAWCEQAGHHVHYVCYIGGSVPTAELPASLDLLFIGAFSGAAHLAYALSNYYRQRGAVTVVGGPHARCYPEDAARFFDYVLGFTHRATIDEVLRECAPHRPLGRQLGADRQPDELPPLAARWKFVTKALTKAPTIKIVPMIGSLGCPYTCSFCIDSTVEYQPLEFGQLTEDLRFLRTNLPHAIVGWHDPNFGVRFDDYMGAIEASGPPAALRHIAEMSLSLLSEPHLARLKANGFKAVLPGIESWYSLGNKSKTRRTGMDKVKQVAEHVNLILRYIPYIQTNFVVGLDCDEGPEPFELTKRFLDLAPGAFPAYSLLSAFGRAAPSNLEYQRAGRMIPFPFGFLDNNHGMNVRPLNYSWTEFYDYVVDLSRYSFSWPMIARRMGGTPEFIPKWMNVVRAISTEGFGRIRYHAKIRQLLDTDPEVRGFLEGTTTTLPAFYANRIRNDLGPLYQHLPPDAIMHDPLAYLKSEAGRPVSLGGPARAEAVPEGSPTASASAGPTRSSAPSAPSPAT